MNLFWDRNYLARPLLHADNISKLVVFYTKKICPWDSYAPLQQTGSRHTTDLKTGDMVQLTLITLQTKYQIKKTNTRQEIFDKH